MLSLQGSRITLRSIRREDTLALLRLESLTESNRYSDNTEHLSKELIYKYIQSQEQCMDIACLRLLIIDENGKILGCLDTFNPQDSSLEIAYIIYDESDRRKGYCTEAYKLLENFLREMFEIVELRARVSEKNQQSLSFLLSLGFLQTKYSDGIYYFRKNLTLETGAYDSPK